MIKCQACGTQNLDTSQYCDECGDSLQKYKAPAVSGSFASESVSAEPRKQKPPGYQSASVTSVGVPPAEEAVPAPETENESDAPGPGEAGDSAPEKSKTVGVHANLVIERGGAVGSEFPISTDESNIGRWDADNGIFPDIDLDSHDPEAKVSRKHARIIVKNGQYLLEDLGSTNGTFVNRGRRLIPGSPHKINDGDEIIVGKTFLRFQIRK